MSVEDPGIASTTVAVAATGEKSGLYRCILAMRYAIGGDRSFVAALIAPALIFFAVLNIVPLLWMVGMSFYRYSLLNGQPPRYVGFANYAALMDSHASWGAFQVTFLFVLASVAVTTIVGLLLGYLFWGSKTLPGRRLALTFLFAPMVLTPASVATFSKLMLSPIFGVVTYIFAVVSGSRPALLSSTLSAQISVLAIDAWMWTPFMVLISLAALAAVPSAEMEAAKVDGLKWITTMRRVVLPHAKYILMLGLLLRTIDAFETTDLVLLLTSGGPGSATELLGLRIYRLGFTSLNFGTASTLSVVALIIAIGFTSMYLYLLSRKTADNYG